MTFLSSDSFNSVIKSLEIASKQKAECQQGWECCNLVGHFFLTFSLFALLLHLKFIFSQIRTYTLCRNNINRCVVLKNTIHFNNWKNTVEQCREKEFHFSEPISFMLFFPPYWMLYNLKLSNLYLNSLYHISKSMMRLIQEMLKAFPSFLCYMYAYVKYSFVFLLQEQACLQEIYFWKLLLFKAQYQIIIKI